MKFVVLLAALLACSWAAKENCDACKDPDFSGFGFEPTEKCGCCPWPCCCKCLTTGDDDKPQQCKSFLEMAFVMDASGSIGTSDWMVAKQFFKDIVSILPDIGKGQKVATVLFSSNASLEWGLNDPETSSKAALDNAISGLQNIGTFTNMVEAMEVVNNEVFIPEEEDLGIPNILAYFTDGRSNFRLNEIGSMAEKTRAKARTLCIAVTNEVNMAELEMLCDKNDIFSVNDFNALTSIVLDVQKKICPKPVVTEKCFCCCTPEQFWAGGGARYYAGRW